MEAVMGLMLMLLVVSLVVLGIEGTQAVARDGLEALRVELLGKVAQRMLRGVGFYLLFSYLWPAGLLLLGPMGYAQAVGFGYAYELLKRLLGR